MGPQGKDVFLLLPITGLFTERDEPAAGSGTATYSTRPSSTMFEVRTPLRPTDAGVDGKPIRWAPNQRLLVSREALRRRITFCQSCKPDTNDWLHPSPKVVFLTDMTPSAAATASSNIATPLSEKKLLWVVLYKGDDSFQCLANKGHPIQTDA